jgi:hypothetical protein
MEFNEAGTAFFISHRLTESNSKTTNDESFVRTSSILFSLLLMQEAIKNEKFITKTEKLFNGRFFRLDAQIEKLHFNNQYAPILNTYANPVIYTN